MTKSIIKIAKEQWASEPVAWTTIDDTGYISKPYSTKASAELHYGKTRIVPLFTTPQPNQDLISRDEAIQAIYEVGGKRMYDFLDAIMLVRVIQANNMNQ